VFSDINVVTLIGAVFTSITSFIPALSDTIFDGARDEAVSYYLNGLYTIAGYIFVVLVLWLLVLRIMRLRLPDPDFSKSFLCTLTPAITSSFSSYAASYRSRDVQALAVDVGPIFDRHEVFDGLVEAVILVDSDNHVITMTHSASHMLSQAGDEVNMDMADFLQNQCKPSDPSTAVRLPPAVPQQIDLTNDLEFWRVYIYPVKKFEYLERTVSYAVRIADIAGLEDAIDELNKMRRWVEVLAAHLVPWPIPDLLFNQFPDDPDSLYNGNDQRKILCATFIISCEEPLDMDQMRELQAQIRSRVSANESFSYSGRSLQFFRVFTGHFDTSVSKGDPGKLAIFAQDLIARIGAFGEAIEREIIVHCGIQSAMTSGLRFRYNVSPTEPLIFEFYESPVLVSTLVAAHGRPNLVNVSRDYRQDIFGQAFRVEIADDIYALNGSPIQVHTVRTGKHTTDDTVDDG
jgi:hypothetical protein